MKVVPRILILWSIADVMELYEPGKYIDEDYFLKANIQSWKWNKRMSKMVKNTNWTNTYKLHFSFPFARNFCVLTLYLLFLTDKSKAIGYSKSISRIFNLYANIPKYAKTISNNQPGRSEKNARSPSIDSPNSIIPSLYSGPLQFRLPINEKNRVQSILVLSSAPIAMPSISIN